MGFSFKRSEVRQPKRGLIDVCKILIHHLFKIVEIIEATVPLESSLLKSIFSVEKQYKAQEFLKRENRRITNREWKFIKRIKPRLKKLGLTVAMEEFSFPTQDRVDLILLDRASKRYYVAEVEISIKENNKIGLLQVLKYRALFVALFNEQINNVGAFLIPKRIHETIKRLRKQYDVRYIESEESWNPN